MSIVEKKKAYYKRMETDFDFRMQQVDKKIMTMNALSGYNKYVRYKTDLYEHDITGAHIETYIIGIYGECKKYKG